VFKASRRYGDDSDMDFLEIIRIQRWVRAMQVEQHRLKLKPVLTQLLNHFRSDQNLPGINIANSGNHIDIRNRNGALIIRVPVNLWANND